MHKIALNGSLKAEHHRRMTPEHPQKGETLEQSSCEGDKELQTNNRELHRKSLKVLR